MMKSHRYLSVGLSSTFSTGQYSIYVDPIYIYFFLKKKTIICFSNVHFEHSGMFLYSFHIIYFRLSL